MYTTSILARLLDLYALSTRAISTNTIKREERRSPATAMAGRLVGKSNITGRKRRSMQGLEVNAGQEVELEVGRA
jgi:hypothetical protein